MTEDAVHSPVTGEKRGPGRPRKDSEPALKKQRTSISEATPTPTPLRPTQTDSPVAIQRFTKLPTRILDTKPLPTLPHPQAISLPDAEYQSIPSSGVLAASLQRSRQAWTHDGIFERYWQKPATGKNARPAPPNNPDLKTMKSKGRCRLRIEPHIFEIEVWIVEKPRPAVQKSYGPVGGYGQPYRTPNQHYSVPQQAAHVYQQDNKLPPINQPHQYNGQGSKNKLPPLENPSQHLLPRQLAAPSQPSPAPSPAPQPAKNSPDPVIAMLATRANSDMELKALMKEVATGKATPEQLKIFQRHIDELTALISSRKAAQEKAAAEESVREKEWEKERVRLEGQRQMLYDGGNMHPRVTPYLAQQQHYPSPTPPPPAPPPQNPVVFAFTTAGATEDRFLFPRHAILDPLSAQHMLASFIVTRCGRDTVDSRAVGPGHEDTVFWQPVTMMVEVAYGREGILADVRRWVEDPGVVRGVMEGVMRDGVRWGKESLALRLPVAGTVDAEGEVEGRESKGQTPVPVEVGAGAKGKKVVPTLPSSGAKKRVSVGKIKGGDAAAAASGGEGGTKRQSLGSATFPASSLVKTPAPASASTGNGTTAADKGDAMGSGKDVAAEAAPLPETSESGRPKRITRKSVRICEN